MAYPGNGPGGQPQSYSYPDVPSYQPQVPVQQAPNDPYAGATAPQYQQEQYGSAGYGYGVESPLMQPQPVSGMPSSGAPMSAPPVSGPPTMMAPAYGGSGYGAPAQPPAGRSGPTIALAVASAVLLLVAGIMTALYANKSGDYTSAQKQIASQKSTISDHETKIKDLNSKQTELQGQLDKTNTDLSGSQSQAAELKRQKAVVSKCLDLFAQVTVAAGNGDAAKAKQLADKAGPICDEAEKYLG
jgi:hypothetical protein